MNREQRRAAERQALEKHMPQYVDWVDVPEAMAIMGLSEMRVKELCRTATIGSQKFKFPGYTKWLIDPEAAREYKPQRAGRSGMSRMILRFNPSTIDIAAVKNYLTATYGAEAEGNWTLARQKSSGKSKSKAKGAQDFAVEIIKRLEDAKKIL